MSYLRLSQQRDRNEGGLQSIGDMEGPGAGGKARGRESRKAPWELFSLPGLRFFIKMDSLEQILPSLSQQEWISLNKKAMTKQQSVIIRTLALVTADP